MKMKTKINIKRRQPWLTIAAADSVYILSFNLRKMPPQTERRFIMYYY